MITLPTATVLIGAMAFSITIMMRSKSQDESLYRNAQDLTNAASQIAFDVESAISFVSTSASHIEFVVPDRDGDKLPEQIRYEFGGTTGSNANTILWKYNQQSAKPMFSDVAAMTIACSRSAASANVPNQSLSEVVTLRSLDAIANGVFKETKINATNAVGQYFVPAVPTVGAKWDLGAIRFMIRSVGPNLDGVLRIRVTASDSTKLPIAPIYADLTIAESTLSPNFQWLEIPIAPISRKAQGTPLCFTIAYASGTGDVAAIQHIENGTGMPSNANLLTSTNGGTSWTASNETKDLRFYAYGFYDGYTGQRAFWNRLDLRLQSTGTGSQQLETSVRVPAMPEIP
jgi:hypothetical protein